MTILEMIAEWRKGCGNTITDDDGNVVPMSLHPEKCPECTLALIDAIERAAASNPLPDLMRKYVQGLDQSLECQAGDWLSDAEIAEREIEAFIVWLDRDRK